MYGWKNPNEDERGVDIGQIRGQLKLTVAERVREMVHAANVLMTMQEMPADSVRRSLADV